MSRPSQPSGSASNGATLRLRVLGERARGDDVGRQHDRERERVLVAQLLGHLAADEHRVGAAAEVLEHAELVLDLGAAGDEHERPLDLAEQRAEMLELGEQQQPRVRGQQVRDPLRRRVRAVGRAERVVDVEVAAVGELARERRVVRGLAGWKRVFSSTLDPLVRKQLAQALARPARSRNAGVLALRPAEVRADARSPRRRARAAARASAAPRGSACRRRPRRPRAGR